VVVKHGRKRDKNNFVSEGNKTEGAYMIGYEMTISCHTPFRTCVQDSIIIHMHSALFGA